MLKKIGDTLGVFQLGFSLILFTLDESTYARELAPLAANYPCLRLGPARCVHDSP